jgi:peptide/nickel transport system permease protein
MIRYIVKRVLLMIPLIFGISVVAFTIIQLPPGDFLTTYVAARSATGESVTQAEVDALRERYGIGDPVFVQYGKWMGGIMLRGDFGRSFRYGQPVSQLIGERIALTFVVSLTTLLFTWVVALPIGIYSAVKQYTIGDYIVTFLGFIGMAIPNFLFALIVLYLGFEYFGFTMNSLFSAEFVNAEWSLARVIDLMKHLWVPVLILGTAGTAGLIRIMRANLLDELKKPYVITARAYGYSEAELVRRFPVRVALNPFISSIGWSLPYLVSGTTIVAIVLNLPTVGPLMFSALVSQDMYLAGSIIFILSVLTMVGTLVSDILLAILDPRIRYA